MVIDKIKKISANADEISKNQEASDMLIGKWIKCDNCKEILYKEEVHRNLSVCPNCGKHFRISSRRRIAQLVDQEMNSKMGLRDPLQFEGYQKKLEGLVEKTQIEEAVQTGEGEINRQKTMLAVMDGNFMMGSMGSVVGEKITLCIEEAIARKLPIILVCVSGGARMQEGIISLMQMAKTTNALMRLNEAGLLSICVLTDPTTGGVTASFASLGDIIIAEPKALIGFAGPRVIEQTVKQKLPEGFQSAEFLLEHGFIDKIVERKDLKKVLGELLKFHTKK